MFSEVLVAHVVNHHKRLRTVDYLVPVGGAQDENIGKQGRGDETPCSKAKRQVTVGIQKPHYAYEQKAEVLFHFMAVERLFRFEAMVQWKQQPESDEQYVPLVARKES